MKSKALLLLAIGCFLTCTIACKKDYPKDIPDWVKEMIRENKLKFIDNTHPDDCNLHCIEIDEYYESNYGIVYFFPGGGSGIFSSYFYYDYDKNLICCGGDCGCKFNNNCCPVNFFPQFRRDIYSSYNK